VTLTCYWNSNHAVCRWPIRVYDWQGRIPHCWRINRDRTFDTSSHVCRFAEGVSCVLMHADRPRSLNAAVSRTFKLRLRWRIVRWRLRHKLFAVIFEELIWRAHSTIFYRCLKVWWSIYIYRSNYFGILGTANTKHCLKILHRSGFLSLVFVCIILIYFFRVSFFSIQHSFHYILSDSQHWVRMYVL